MIEQVGGRGRGVVMNAFFRQVFRATVFLCRFFSNSVMPFWGRFYQHLHIFGRTLCAFHQKVKQCFGHKIFVMYN